MRDVRRVLGLGRRHAVWIVLAFFSMVLAAAATVFAFNLVRPIYDQVLRPAPAEEATPRHPTTGVVEALDSFAGRAEEWLAARVGGDRFSILALAALAIVVKNFFAFLARFASARFGLETIHDLRDRFFRSLLDQGPAYFHERSTATFVSQATHDVQLLREALAERLGDVAQDLVTVPVILVYLLSLDPRLTLATAMAAPLFFLPVVHLSRRLRTRARQAQERTGDLAVVIDETVRGMRMVQNYGMKAFVVERFGRANRRQFLASLWARAIQVANGPVMEIVGTVAALAVVAYAASRITAGEMTLGDFSAFVLGAYAIYNPLKRLNKFNLVLQQASVAAARLYEVIDAPAAVGSRPNARPLDGLSDGIRFMNVGFAYPRGRRVLRGFDLHLPHRATLALVGVSGAGKSTVAQLIPRFFDVDDGGVRVGGEDVRDLEVESLRQHIGLVTQETLLFNDTVRSNILCGRTAFGDDAVEAAARIADAETFVRSLPEGFDTIVGEGGIKVSGGQRQRLAIARSVLAGPSIVILDEATSAIDPESEERIHEALRAFLPDATVLVVSHRLATIMRADIIAVLENGRVAELGNHAELLAANGAYHRMVQTHDLS